MAAPAPVPVSSINNRAECSEGVETYKISSATEVIEIKPDETAKPLKPEDLPASQNPTKNANKDKKQQSKKGGRGSSKPLLKQQSSLEANDTTLGRQDSWQRRLHERTRRSRSTEEDCGDNAIELSQSADLIEDRLYLGKNC